MSRGPAASGFGSPAHLARRFFLSLSRKGPDDAAEAWACSFLGEGERDLWRQMSAPDRRHAMAVARCLGPDETVAVPAALLHDVGKIDSRLGPLRRAAATAAALALGRSRMAQGRGRMARYLCHDSLGAALLERAGSEALTVAWAREHHLPADRWTVPRHLGRSLKAADDD
jgi:putative nucleotidyltransferase with HDIG domain